MPTSLPPPPPPPPSFKCQPDSFPISTTISLFLHKSSAMEGDELQMQNWSAPSLRTGSPSCSTNELSTFSTNTDNTPCTHFSTSLSMSFPDITHSSYSSNTANDGILMDSALHMMGFLDPPPQWLTQREERGFSSSLEGDSPSSQTRSSFSAEYMDLEFTHDVPYNCSTSMFQNLIQADPRMKQPLFENNRSTMGISSLQQHSYWDVPPLELRPPWQPQLACSTMDGSPVGDISLQSSAVLKKNGNEGSVKRSRAEASSPLPNLKARKEKLGDRITALQQLVSPFGKTDTASVLHEAIEKIKFLHDQVNVLSMPYMKSGVPYQFQKLQSHAADREKESEVFEQDLRSRGLCLVPVSLTFPAASSNESMVDFWTPTFGGTLKWASHQR